MKIAIVCSSDTHPVFPYLSAWVKSNAANHQIDLVTSISELNEPGDILFLVSCSEIVRKQTRDLFRYTLVLHASDLPQGRGWSPHIWEVINGSQQITLSLLNAEDGVDTGDIWQKIHIPLSGHELFDDINHKLFSAEVELISWACKNIDQSKPTAQSMDVESSYYRKRTPEDSQLDADASIRSQFNLLRVCDPKRFPAYVVINGVKYYVRLEKDNEQ